MNFSVELTNLDPTTLEIKVSGYFDEFSDLPKDVDFSKFQSVEVDFGAVEFINSGGVKVWVNFIDDLKDHEHLKIYYKNCPPKIVDQVNLIANFLPANGEVLSVFIPVFCNKCTNTFKVLQKVAEIDDLADEDVIARTSPDCADFPACNKFFEVDTVLRQYFRFRKPLEN